MKLFVGTVEFSTHSAPIIYTSFPSHSSVVSCGSSGLGHIQSRPLSIACERATSLPPPISHGSVDDPDEDESERGYAMGDDEIDILVDPSLWHPFPHNSIFLTRDEKTTGFRTRSGVVYGPEKIEVPLDVPLHRA